MKKIVIIGAGGHGEVCAEIAELNGYQEIIFLDNDTQKQECAGYPVIGTMKQIENFMEYDFFVAVGNNKTRKKISDQIKKACVTLIHPKAIISRSVHIEEGCVIMAQAVINANTIIQEGCILNTGCTIDHDCILESYVHISPGCHLGGTCRIGECTWVGIGSSIINNITVGSNVMIAAGSIVYKDIESGMKMVGKIMKQNENGGG